MADSTPKSYHTDPTLYLYTSLTAGSSHIITGTSRLETILKANKIPFLALDVATDEKARMLWGRRAGKKKLPGLVRMGMIVGDLEEVEEWNEYGELAEKVGTGPIAPSISTPSAPSTPSKAPKNVDSPSKAQLSAATPPRPLPSSTTDSPLTTAMRQAGLEAAKKAGDAKSQVRVKIGVPNASNEATKKLDNFATTGLPPPSGITKARSDTAPGTGSAAVKSKADTVSVTAASEGKNSKQSRSLTGGRSSAGDGQDEESSDSSSEEVDEDEAKNSNIGPTKQSDADAGTSDEEDDSEPAMKSTSRETKPDAGDIDIVKTLKDQGKTGGPLLDRTKIKTTNTTAATNERQPPPGKRPQDQAAADAKEVGESVGD